MNWKNSRKIVAGILIAAFLFGCGTKKGKNEVIIHELSDTDMLTPFNYQSASTQYVLAQLFQSLLGQDPVTFEDLPGLAKAVPTPLKDSTGKGMSITYEIREDAKWDDGTPITGNDVAFSMKVIKNPKTDCQPYKGFFDFVEDVVTDPSNPKKVTFVCNNVHMHSVENTGGLLILPSKIYDPKNLMASFTVKQLNDTSKALASDPKIIEFATNYNSEKYQREKGYIVGSGAYEFSEWITGQKIVLKRKKNWWGEKYEKENVGFQAYPQQLVYQTINDYTAAIVALKGKKLDVAYGIKYKDFTELPKSEKVKENFNLHTPRSMQYHYFGMNLRNPKFADKKVRQALAHLTDVDKMVSVLTYGLADRVIGPIHPSKKEIYNSNIKPYDYNIEEAKKLLDEAGWKDSNHDGILDKNINGEHVEFNITFTYNAGNDTRRDAGLMFKESCRQAGINVDVVPQEWAMYIQNQKQHKFEMFYGAWVGSTLDPDEKQIWHTEAIEGGSNYVFFGNAETDKLVDDIRTELDAKKRAPMYLKFQEILHDESPYIFLFAPKERIAISKRFTNAEAYDVRPGFAENMFKLEDK
ncbi:MAG: extracellular solute-binding protein [Bacteroidetes bacterium]|nr:extracellular solute-binding protein [Bacteroidota bacterium]